jgi:hypothetical protein
MNGPNGYYGYLFRAGSSPELSLLVGFVDNIIIIIAASILKIATIRGRVRALKLLIIILMASSYLSFLPIKLVRRI